MQENQRRVGCLGGIVAILAACIGIGIFASVNESCDCATAAAVRSSTVECSVGGSFGIHIRDRDYAEVCLSPGDTTTTEEEDVPEDEIVTCECNGTTEVCTDGTTTANALACVPEEAEFTCECEGTTEVCSDGTSTENAVACQPPTPALSGPLLTGEVLTLCDTVNRPVNLRLVTGADTALISSELTNGNLMVSIGGTDISNTCGVNPGNATLLTCTYPANVSIPAQGLVTYNGSQIDSFTFNGEEPGCTPPSNGDTTDGDTKNGEPDTCDPTQTGTLCFCEQNPDDESCITSD